MARSALARVAGTVQAPAEARRFAATFVAGLPAADELPRGDIAMVVSELVTNAVRAGARTITVQLVAESERLEIEVSDDVEGWPTLRVARNDETTGRGLALVQALAETWGVRRLPGSGKQVWARIRLA